MRHEINVLADDEEFSNEERILSMNLIVRSGMLLEAAFGEKSKGSDVTLIEGSLRVSF